MSKAKNKWLDKGKVYKSKINKAKIYKSKIKIKSKNRA